jgi:diacylglycerol kinase family enzyme
MHNTKRKEKRRFGMFAYLYRAIGSIIRSDMHRFQVVVDDKQIRFSATEVMLTSHKLMGLQPQFDGVEVDPNDGRLDMFIVRAKSLPGYLKVILRFIRPTAPDEDPNLRYVEVHKSIQIKSDVPLPVQADGEVVGNTPVEVNLIPHALEVIVPCAEKPEAK